MFILITYVRKLSLTFLGEYTPTVLPSSLTATPISANTASR